MKWALTPIHPGGNSTPTLMKHVMGALVPGTLTMSWVFGPGVLFNVLLASLAAVGFEALALTLRRRAVTPSISDGSALLAGWLLALAFPPFMPAWLTIFGAAIAMLLGKHLYGGLGKNPFNPAMVAYAFLLISFPKELTAWTTPVSGELLENVSLWLGSLSGSTTEWHAITSATPLDRIRSGDVVPSKLWIGDGWAGINAAFMAGGLYLLFVRIINWHIPVTLLVTVSMLYCIDYYFFHASLFPVTAIFSGAMMLAAFFIATDPVSAATSYTGRIIYAAGIGLLIFSIRKWGAYPEGVAFAVLLMNTAAPAIDYYCRPSVVGSN